MSGRFGIASAMAITMAARTASPNAATAKVECRGRPRSSARDGRPTPLLGQSSSVSSEKLRRRSRPEATIAVEMLKQTALDFVGEPAIGTETCAEEAGDVALDGALVRAFDRAFDGIDDAA